MKYLLIFVINIYKTFVSPFLTVAFGGGCRYTPTCSEYAKEAISKYGAAKGGRLALLRIARCHPLSPGGWDPVPNDTKLKTEHSKMKTQKVLSIL